MKFVDIIFICNKSVFSIYILYYSYPYLFFFFNIMWGGGKIAESVELMASSQMVMSQIFIVAALFLIVWGGGDIMLPFETEVMVSVLCLCRAACNILRRHS